MCCVLFLFPHSLLAHAQTEDSAELCVPLCHSCLPRAREGRCWRKGTGQEVPTLPRNPDRICPTPGLSLQRKCTHFLINLIWASKAFPFRSCPVPGSLMDPRQGVKHGPACRRFNYRH